MDRGAGKTLGGVRLLFELVELPSRSLTTERILLSQEIDEPVTGEPIRLKTPSTSVSQYGGPLAFRVTLLRGTLPETATRSLLGTLRFQRGNIRQANRMEA